MPAYTPPTGKVSSTPKRRADKAVSDAAMQAAATPATKTTAGVVKQAAFMAQLSAAPTQANFNTLLTSLIAAGLMASS